MGRSLRNPVFFLLGITLCIYLQVVSFDFVNLDDPSHLDNNPVFSPLTPSRYLKVWKQPIFLYMPITYSVWSVGVLLSPPRTVFPSPTGSASNYRFSPFLFHVFPLLFHLLAAYFVYLTFQAFGLGLGSSFLGALIFALHPLQAEPVSWVSGLKDTLSGALFFASLYFFLKKKNFLSVALFVMSLCSKPSAVVLPPILFLLAHFHLKDPWKVAAKKALPYFSLTLPILWMTYRIQATETLHFVPPPFFKKILVALLAIRFYAGKLVWPFDLAVDYGKTPKWVLSSPTLYLEAGAVLIGLGGLFYLLHRKGLSKSVLALCLALIAIFPVLGFKPFTFQTTSTVSDRFMYLPLFFVILGLAPLLDKIVVDRKKTLLAALVLLLLALRTNDQIQHWKNTITLLNRSLEVNPRSWLAHNNLGSFLESRGHLPKALEHYRAAASLDRQGIFYNNIATICMYFKDFSCAREAYEEAIAINPLSSIDRNGLGFVYLGTGNKEKARELFEEALQLNPYLFQAKHGLELTKSLAGKGSAGSPSRN